MDKLLELMTGYISAYDLASLRDLWHHLNAKIFSRLDSPHSTATVAKLETSILRDDNMHNLTLFGCLKSDSIQAVRGQLHTNQEAGKGEGVLREAGGRAAGQLRLEGVVRPPLRPQPGGQPRVRGLLQPPVAGHPHANAVQLPLHRVRVPARAAARRLQGRLPATEIHEIICSNWELLKILLTHFQW